MKKKTLAIPIRIANFSDSSQVLTLFTRSFGILECIAKGAHRERNAFQGPFDLGVLWEVVFAERPPERGLSILTEGSVVEGFRGARGSMRRWTAAAFLLEYLRAVGTAGEFSGDLFDLAASALRALSGPPSPEAAAACLSDADRTAWVLVAFQARALRILGLSAPAHACSDCGKPWSRSDRPVFFCTEAGGILCERCRRRMPRQGGRVVPGGVVRALEELASGSVLESVGLSRGAGGDRGPGGEAGFGPEALKDLDSLRQLERLLADLGIFQLDREFVMVRYRNMSASTGKR